MRLLASTRISPATRTTPPRRSAGGLRAAGGRRCAATWPSSAAAWPACRPRWTWPTAAPRGAAGSARSRLRRQRPQRRPGHPRPGLRPGRDRRPAGPGRSPARLGHVDRGAGPDAPAHHAHGIDCDWRDGYLGVATSARKARDLLAWADRMDGAYGYPLCASRRPTCRSWIASPRYHSGVHDPRSGHLHPLKYTLGLAGGRRLGVRCTSTRRSPRCTQGDRPCCTPPTARSPAPGAAGRQRLPAGPRAALEARIMPAGTYIVQRAAASPGAPADPQRLGGVRHQLRARLLPHHRRPPHALRRPGQLQHRHAGTWPRACASAWWHLPAAGRHEGRPTPGAASSTSR
jgi:hypothetical protein